LNSTLASIEFSIFYVHKETSSPSSIESSSFNWRK